MTYHTKLMFYSHLPFRREQARHGMGVWKRLVSEGSSGTESGSQWAHELNIDIFAAPVQFEMPPVENDTPWVMELTGQ